MPFTATQPKCFTEVAGTLEFSIGRCSAFRQNGLDKFVFVGGYLIDVVRDTYPDFTYVENRVWSTTNILASLVCARDYMAEGFYATYTDTLYLRDAVKSLQDSPHDITLVMDTRWRETVRVPQHAPRVGRGEDDRRRRSCGRGLADDCA